MKIFNRPKTTRKQKKNVTFTDCVNQLIKSNNISLSTKESTSAQINATNSSQETSQLPALSQDHLALTSKNAFVQQSSLIMDTDIQNFQMLLPETAHASSKPDNTESSDFNISAIEELLDVPELNENLNETEKIIEQELNNAKRSFDDIQDEQLDKQSLSADSGQNASKYSLDDLESTIITTDGEISKCNCKWYISFNCMQNIYEFM